MTNSNLIHVKLEYEEAVQSKKEIFSSEINLLKIVKNIKKYQLLRTEELKIKTKVLKKLKETNINIKKLQTNLPKIKIPEKLKKQGEEKSDKIELKLEKIKEKHYDSDLESQLKEIQEKLNAIQ